MGKAFEKQIKTIEDRGEKEIKAIQDRGNVKTNTKYDYDDEDSLLISKQKKKKIDKLVDERLKEITELAKKVKLDDLVYRYKGKSPGEEFDKYHNTLDLINKIQNGKIKLSEAKNYQIIFKSHLGEINKGSNKKGAKKRTIKH